MEPSALSVHANIYTPKGEFEAEGDDRLRSNFHQRMREMLRVSDEFEAFFCFFGGVIVMLGGGLNTVDPRIHAWP